ncbi:MAG: hypothetical protein AAGJ29_08995 [Pseudomonadota bacterium]
MSILIILSVAGVLAVNGAEQATTVSAVAIAMARSNTDTSLMDLT